MENNKGGFLIDDRPGKISKKGADKLKKYLIKEGYKVSLVSDKLQTINQKEE